MLNLEKLLDVVKQILHVMKYGNKSSMVVLQSQINGEIITIPSSVKSFNIINLGANGNSLVFSNYTISNGNYNETVTKNELSISRDAGVNSYFLDSYIVTPAVGDRIKVVYIK